MSEFVQREGQRSKLDRTQNLREGNVHIRLRPLEKWSFWRETARNLHDGEEGNDAEAERGGADFGELTAAAPETNWLTDVGRRDMTAYSPITMPFAIERASEGVNGPTRIRSGKHGFGFGGKVVSLDSFLRYDISAP